MDGHKETRGFTKCNIIGNVPLFLIVALCRDKSNLFGDSNTYSTMGLHINHLATGWVLLT